MRELLCLLAALCLLLPAGAATVEVGPRRAVKSVRAALEQAAGPVTVRLDPGDYLLTEPLALGSGQSLIGPGARLIGGRRLTDWQPVSDPAVLARIPAAAHPHVVEADLRAAGVTDFGALRERGFGKAIVPAHLELFYNSQPMTLARYPNSGEFRRVAELPDGQEGMTLTCADERVRRWSAEPEPWIFGYWFHDWADVYQPIAGIDANGVITLGGAKPNYGIRPNQRFYGFNLLGELDTPGEWYLDRAAGRLYFWPPEPGGEAVVSVGETFITVTGAEDVRIEGLTFEACRGTAIVIRDSTDVQVVACTIRNTGNRAVTISGGARCAVLGCDIRETGDGGIVLSGGDRATLTAAGHQAVNNAITRYSRWCRTYRPAVQLDGVGQQVLHNLIWDGPHNGIQLGGNEHRIEYNELHDVCWETGDVGAFYMGRDWTARGTVIRHNHFHHIQGPGQHGAMGVYLDDAASGISILGNRFVATTRAMFIGGGRDNLVEGNLFVDCRPALHIDARGIGWMAYHVEGDGTLPTRLREMPIESEPWRTRYPQLLRILDDEPGAPKNNLIRSNVSIGGVWEEVEEKARPYQTIERNHVVEAEPLDQTGQPLPGSPAYEAGFRRLPVDRMGLQQDLPRASWPVEHPRRE